MSCRKEIEFQEAKQQINMLQRENRALKTAINQTLFLIDDSYPLSAESVAEFTKLLSMVKKDFEF